MRIVDANVLIYAVNSDSERHDEARGWLDASLGGAAPVGLAWLALLAFVRLATKPAIFPHPLTVEGALDRVDAWIAAPAAVVVEPTARHAAVVRDLLAAVGTGGNLVSDAHLAALAVEHRGRVVSYDSDFGRFPGVRWERPGVGPGR